MKMLLKIFLKVCFVYMSQKTAVQKKNSKVITMVLCISKFRPYQCGIFNIITWLRRKA